jgi:Ca2+-binding EF-hand superfamily protein
VLETAFTQYDTDKNGAITVDEMIEIVRSSSGMMSLSLAMSLINQVFE